jgi:hypothetical protein
MKGRFVMKLRSFACVLVAAAATVVLAGSARAATWTPTTALSDAVAGTDDVQLVAGSDGRVLVVWDFRLGTGVRGVEAVSRRPDGRWGPPRPLGTWVPVTGAPAKGTGVGDDVSALAAYGANRWLGLAIAQTRGPRESLDWWKGTTIGAAHRGGALPEEPWETGRVAAFHDGTAVMAYTTMRPRRGSGSNLRPRVVVVARGSRAGFGATRRLSPLPPGPPYGSGLGPALSATDATVAVGGRATVVVAWQRVGRIEARVSRDRGRTYGPVRYLGPSPEAYPSLAARVSPAGKVVVVWGGRETQGPDRVLVSRAAFAVPGGRFATRELDRSRPLDPSAPSASDQRGPRTLVGFDGEIPLAAWQTVVDGRTAVRTARLAGDPMTATFTAAAGEQALLDDLTTAPIGAAAIGWHAVTPLGGPQNGFIAQAPSRRPFGDAQRVPATDVSGLRLAYEATGLLAAWNGRAGTTSTVLAAELR